MESTLLYLIYRRKMYRHLFLQMALTATQWLRCLNLNIAVEDINKVEYLGKYLSNSTRVSSNISAAVRRACLATINNAYD